MLNGKILIPTHGKSFLAVVGRDARKPSINWSHRESCPTDQVRTPQLSCAFVLAGLGVYCALMLSAATAFGDTLYDASLGTLPQSQEFTYSGDQGNTAPTIASGLLLQNKTVPNTAQYWSATDTSTNFSSAFTIEASLLVNSSNFVSNVGDGSSREGYYLFATDNTGRAYSVGIVSSGVVLNDYPNGHVIPYTLTNGFHTFDLSVTHSLASLSIDGAMVVSGVAPESAGIQGVADLTYFGAAGGASVSNTELSFFCSSDSGASCAPAATSAPEPNSWLLLLAGLALIALCSRTLRSSIWAFSVCARIRIQSLESSRVANLFASDNVSSPATRGATYSSY